MTRTLYSSILSGRALAMALAIGLVTFSSGQMAWAQDSEESEEATAEEGAEEGGETESAGVGSLRRSNRMEFDARLIRGETAGSGAVFLFQRAPRALPSMVPLRKSYLQQSVDNVLTPGWTPPKQKSTTSATSEDILESTVVTQGTSTTTVSDEASTTKKTSSKKKKAASRKKRSKKRKRKKSK